jgi:hypothetical protein
MLLNYAKPLYYRPPFPEERLTETLTIPWFSAVTNDNAEPPTCSLALKRVPTVTNAAESISSDSWGDFQLERRNDLTSHLAVRMQHRDSEWNKCAVAFRDYFEREIVPVLRAACQRHGLPESVLRGVGWDVVGYWQEVNYRDVRRPAFFNHLFELYRHGHLPCGWEGSDIQSGSNAIILYR